MPCSRQAFCHKNQKMITVNIYLNDHLKQKTYSSYGGNPLGQVPSPCAPFCPLSGQNLAPLGSIKVHLKTDVMKITYQLREQHLALFKTSILPEDQTK